MHPFDPAQISTLLATYGYGLVLATVALESAGVPLPGETVLVGAAVYAGTTHQMAIAGVIFVEMFKRMQNRWKIDDVLGVWPLHGLCGLWGGIACGIFGLTALGGLGGVSFAAQLVGSLLGAAYAFAGGLLVYGGLKIVMGLRLSVEEERQGADLAIHKISANPEEDVRMGRV